MQVIKQVVVFIYIGSFYVVRYFAPHTFDISFAVLIMNLIIIWTRKILNLQEIVKL